jgi:hypothetical protein
MPKHKFEDCVAIYFNDSELELLKQLGIRENYIELLGKEQFEVDAPYYKHKMYFSESEINTILYYISKHKFTKCLEQRFRTIKESNFDQDVTSEI